MQRREAERVQRPREGPHAAPEHARQQDQDRARIPFFLHGAAPSLSRNARFLRTILPQPRPRMQAKAQFTPLWRFIHKKLAKIIEKMYDEIVEEEIADSMEKIRIILEFAPEDYIITRMKDSFCKCVRNKVVKVNPDIIKYNKKIIEISLIQAFCETMYKKDTDDYKDLLQYAIEKYEKRSSNLIKIINISKKVEKVS